MILLELASEKLVPLDASSYSNYVNDKISSSSLEDDLASKDIDYGTYHARDAVSHESFSVS